MDYQGVGAIFRIKGTPSSGKREAPLGQNKSLRDMHAHAPKNWDRAVAAGFSV
jgi:hypothetical protein